MSTPTPRTDAEEWTAGSGDAETVVWADFSRTMERELYAVEATLASERGDHLRELAAEREKVQILERENAALRNDFKLLKNQIKDYWWPT